MCILRLWKLKNYRKYISQTCGIAVADHLLQFCGISGCEFECKFAVPSTGPLRSWFWRPTFILGMIAPLPFLRLLLAQAMLP